MTNAELLAKIKAEIEKRLALQSLIKGEFAEGSRDALNGLLSFLDTLESEGPVPADLEEAAIKFAVFYDQGTCDGIAQDCFIAGAKWQAEQLLKSSPLPEDTVLFNKGVAEGKRLAEEEQADLFTIVALDAAQRAKEQMMKEAVEGVVCYGSKGAYIETDFLGEYNTDVYGNPGDKVRVIVIPNTDEK